jgi:type IV fimbrial biogenesis protein FimT
MKSYKKNKEGFTLLEMMVVVAIVGIIVVISISNIISLLPGYRLKSAARDIYSNFQLANLGAVRENKNWAVVFDVTANPGRYFVCSDNNGDGWNGPPVMGGNDNLEKTVNLSDYKSGVDYGHGNATNAVGGTFGDEITFKNNVVVFNPRGLSNAGYIYLENKNKNGTCAVGCLSSGVIILKKWNGVSWE